MNEENSGSLKTLLAYRYQSVANLMARSAQVRYRAEFDLAIGEWRALALLADRSPMSLNELALASALDKGQMSRVAKALVTRKLIRREPSSRGGKLIELSLSPQGRQLYHRVMVAALERDEAFNGCLTDEERACLNSAMVKLGALALEMVRAHKRAGQDPASDPAHVD